MQPMQPRVALKQLEETPDWASFRKKAESFIDLDIVSGTGVKELNDIPSHFLDIKLEAYKILFIVTDSIYFHSRQSLPGYQALISTGDGDCLFNLVSILLYGSEEYSHYLRLSSVIHAVHHFDHYLNMVCII